LCLVPRMPLLELPFASTAMCDLRGYSITRHEQCTLRVAWRTDHVADKTATCVTRSMQAHGCPVASYMKTSTIRVPCPDGTGSAVERGHEQRQELHSVMSRTKMHTMLMKSGSNRTSVNHILPAQKQRMNDADEHLRYDPCNPVTKKVVATSNRGKRVHLYASQACKLQQVHRGKQRPDADAAGQLYRL